MLELYYSDLNYEQREEVLDCLKLYHQDSRIANILHPALIGHQKLSPNNLFNKINSNISDLEKGKKIFIFDLLKEVQKIQKSNLDYTEKSKKIKNILWKNQTPTGKLVVGGVLGTATGLAIFGTGGIGIAGLGSAIGIWGFLAGTTGGVLVSSLLQNYEGTSKRK